MQCCLDSVQQLKQARLQRSDVPRTIFPVCFYVIHNMSKRSIKDLFSVIQDENSGSNDEEGKLLDRIAWPCRQTSTAHPQGKRHQCWECARPVCTAQRKMPRSLLINDNCTIKRKTLLSACLRMMGSTTKTIFLAPSLLKIRARRFVLCLYSHNYFEQEIKNAVFSLSLLRFLDHVLVRSWKNDHATRLPLSLLPTLAPPCANVMMLFCFISIHHDHEKQEWTKDKVALKHVHILKIKDSVVQFYCILFSFLFVCLFSFNFKRH